jgi:hypothetical protein
MMPNKKEQRIELFYVLSEDEVQQFLAIQDKEQYVMLRSVSCKSWFHKMIVPP